MYSMQCNTTQTYCLWYFKCSLFDGLPTVAPLWTPLPPPPPPHTTPPPLFPFCICTYISRWLAQIRQHIGIDSPHWVFFGVFCFFLLFCFLLLSVTLYIAVKTKCFAFIMEWVWFCFTMQTERTCNVFLLQKISSSDLCSYQCRYV